MTINNNTNKHIYIYIYIYSSNDSTPAWPSLPCCRFRPLSEFRGHAERPHPQKSDLIDMLYLKCSE